MPLAVRVPEPLAVGVSMAVARGGSGRGGCTGGVPLPLPLPLPLHRLVVLIQYFTCTPAAITTTNDPHYRSGTCRAHAPHPQLNTHSHPQLDTHSSTPTHFTLHPHLRLVGDTPHAGHARKSTGNGNRPRRSRRRGMCPSPGNDTRWQCRCRRGCRCRRRWGVWRRPGARCRCLHRVG